MESEEYVSVEVPGLDAVRGRQGTSTVVLAGAAKHWANKAKTAKIDGLVAGITLTLFAELLLGVGYYIIRSL